MILRWTLPALDFTRFSVIANGVDITPQIDGSPDTVTIPLPSTVTEANADSIEITLEIWDKPDRRWSRERPDLSAANRTRRTVTGSALLRMAGSAPSIPNIPSAPSTPGTPRLTIIGN